MSKWIDGDWILNFFEPYPDDYHTPLGTLRACVEDAPSLDCNICEQRGRCEQPCLGCGCCGLYEAMTGNDKLKEKVVEFIKSCARCKHRPIGAMMCEESCHYEPMDEPQTDCAWKRGEE